VQLWPHPLGTFTAVSGTVRLVNITPAIKLVLKGERQVTAGDKAVRTFAVDTDWRWLAGLTFSRFTPHETAPGTCTAFGWGRVGSGRGDEEKYPWTKEYGSPAKVRTSFW
jgi:hypothetical protein